MRNLTVEPEFRDKIPPLTDEEFKKLEENILADGEVREPLVVWNNTIIDGHHRWRIIQNHPEIPYKVKQMTFADKWAAIVWMCHNQLGRRNLTDTQKTALIGDAYKAQKMTQGAADGFRGNQHTKVVSAQNEHLPKTIRTADKIAEKFGVGKETVKRAEHFVDGLDRAEKVSPGFKTSVLSGEIKAPKNLISEMRNIPEEKQREAIDAVRRGDILTAKTIIKKDPDPEPEEERPAYNAKDFYADICAAVKNFDFALKLHLVSVHRDMLNTADGVEAAKKALSEAEKVIEKYTEMIRKVEEINEEN